MQRLGRMWAQWCSPTCTYTEGAEGHSFSDFEAQLWMMTS